MKTLPCPLWGVWHGYFWQISGLVTFGDGSIMWDSLVVNAVDKTNSPVIIGDKTNIPIAAKGVIADDGSMLIATIVVGAM